jgi:hypothetical protein
LGKQGLIQSHTGVEVQEASSDSVWFDGRQPVLQVSLRFAIWYPLIPARLIIRLGFSKTKRFGGIVLKANLFAVSKRAKLTFPPRIGLLVVAP